MYLSSFPHREELFMIAERWFCGQLHGSDARRLTEILICDGFILGETLRSIMQELLLRTYGGVFQQRRIRVKGELREALCRHRVDATPRERELFDCFHSNPEFFYHEAPIDGFMCLGSEDQVIGLYRIKRARRIAEKANRKIAGWIFGVVQGRAQQFAERRAERLGIPIESLLTPESEMAREFIEAERAICEGFRRAEIALDRTALTIHDVGGIKVVADDDLLEELRVFLTSDDRARVINTDNFEGHYRAKSMVLEYPWDPERVFRTYRDTRAWEHYRHRGIPEADLARGLERLVVNPQMTLNIELILSTFPDLVESELGNSIHEERIIAQRDNRDYKGYIPMNVEFLLEYLFAVGFSPTIDIAELPIKLWGRYLPDTLISHIRRLNNLPEHDLF